MATFENTSGKYIQHPLRLSDDFKWQPGERVEIIRESSTESPEPGYIVRNLDYCGMEQAFEKAWISKTLLNANFTQID